jgi:hypothetical protein
MARHSADWWRMRVDEVSRDADLRELLPDRWKPTTKPAPPADFDVE